MHMNNNINNVLKTEGGGSGENEMNVPSSTLNQMDFSFPLLDWLSVFSFYLSSHSTCHSTSISCRSGHFHHHTAFLPLDPHASSLRRTRERDWRHTAWGRISLILWLMKSSLDYSVYESVTQSVSHQDVKVDPGESKAWDYNWRWEISFIREETFFTFLCRDIKDFFRFRFLFIHLSVSLSFITLSHLWLFCMK